MERPFGSQLSTRQCPLPTHGGRSQHAMFAPKADVVRDLGRRHIQTGRPSCRQGAPCPYGKAKQTDPSPMVQSFHPSR